MQFAFTPVAIAFAVVGALVAARTGNNLGWLLLGTGVVAAVVLVTRAYAARVPAAELPAAACAGWVFTVALWISAPLLVLPLLVFLVGAAAMIVRFRRSGREQRLQLKWLMLAGSSSTDLRATCVAVPVTVGLEARVVCSRPAGVYALDRRGSGRRPKTG